MRDMTKAARKAKAWEYRMHGMQQLIDSDKY